MALRSKILIGILVLAIVSIGGWWAWYQFHKSSWVSCGGWDTFGEVVCECQGEIEKPACPPKALCDAGTYRCYGDCGQCRCYAGPAEDHREIPCNGRDKLFR